MSWQLTAGFLAHPGANWANRSNICSKHNRKIGVVPDLTFEENMLLCLCCMSARKTEIPGALHHVTLEARQTRLSLSPDSVIFHRNGIEFRSATPFSPWAEMTLALRSPHDPHRVHCNGVVISCTGNKHAGYHVSMVFTGLSRQAEARLSALSQLY